MTQQYSQTAEVTVGGKAKATQWLSVTALLVSLGFIVLSVFFNWFLMFGFAFFFAIGAIELHIYNATAKEYVYNFSPVRLVIAKKDIVGRTRRVANIVFKDARFFKPLDGVADDGDLVCCGDVSALGVYELTFDADGKQNRLIFAPDEYMTELIDGILSASEAVGEAAQ